MSEALLAFVTGKSPAYLRAHADEPLPDEIATAHPIDCAMAVAAN